MLFQVISATILTVQVEELCIRREAAHSVCTTSPDQWNAWALGSGMSFASASWYATNAIVEWGFLCYERN